MRVLFHPEFPKDVRRFQANYAQISKGLAERFRNEVDQAVEQIKSKPTRAGHFLIIGSDIVPDLRRRNLRAFPFFVLYGFTGDQLIFGFTHSQPLRSVDLAVALSGNINKYELSRFDPLTLQRFNAPTL